MPFPVLLAGSRIVFEDGAKAYDYPTAMDIEFGRKVRTLAGLYQFTMRTWRDSLTARNPMRFHFISYKLGRLLLPWALILIAVSSVFLPAPLAALAMAGQALVYSLAALDQWIPDSLPLKRISGPARAFLLLMAASLRAVSVFFVPAGDLWKTTHVRAPKVSG